MINFSEFLESQEPLNEAQENYDIKAKYDAFNKKLFGGKLPNNFTMRFSRTKKAGGAVLTTYWTKGRGAYKRIDRWEIEELYLSTFFLRTEEQMDGILVHEMIHVYLTVNEKHEGYNVKLHGPEFVEMRNKLQSKVGFEIPMYDTPSMRGEISTRTKRLNLGVVMTTVNNLPDSIIVFTEKALLSNQEKLKEILLKHVEEGTEIIIGTSDHPSLEEFPIKRTVSSMALYNLNDSLYDNLKKDFNELERIKKEGSVSQEAMNKKLNDQLFKLTMKLMASKPNSKQQEQLKVDVNALRQKLGMELMAW